MRTRFERGIAWKIALWAFGFRLVSALVGFLANVVFPLNQPEQLTVFGDTSPFWDTFARYDSGYFQDIAWGGYAPVAGGRSNIAYFPVYPLLMRFIGRLFGRTHASFYITGVGIAWVCFVLAIVALYYLARLDLPRRQAERAVLLMTIYPFSFFFGVAYSESTFILFAILAFYLFRTKRFILGGVCGAVATATRVPGILILPALAWIAWQQAFRDPDNRPADPSAPPRASRVRAAIGLALVPTGIGAYSAYIYSLTGNPFEWAATIQRWGYYPGRLPWDAPMRLVTNLVTHPYAYLASDPMAPYDTLYGVTGILFVTAIPFVWRRFGAAYGLFMLLNLYLPFSSGALEGIGRYCSTLFPCFIWLGTIRSRHLMAALVVVFAVFYTLGLALFTTIHPLY